jgi:hypothetical protein
VADLKSPDFAPAAALPTTAPKPKQRPIPKTVHAAIDALLDGSAKNLTQAAQRAGCSREYLSRFLSRRPDAVAFMQQRAARTLGVASTVAAARMASLIHAESEHVSYRAAEHVLGVSGIKPARDPQVNVNIVQSVGYCIDLRGRTDPAVPVVRHEGGAGVVLVNAEDDGKPIEGEAHEVKPPEVTKLLG